MSKYHNKKTTYYGITFDSKAEAQTYLVLREREKAGQIKDLTLQPPYVLQPAFTNMGGSKCRPITYVADFTFYDVGLGRQRVIDTKGMKTEVYKIKRKLFDYKYKEQGLYVEEKV